MGIGRTNIGGGQRIKKTVLVDDYMIPIGQAYPNVTKTYTIPEDGYYELYCCCTAATSGTGTYKSTISYRDKIEYHAPSSTWYYTAVNLTGTASSNSPVPPEMGIVKETAYIHAGTVITFNISTTNISLYGSDVLWDDGYKFNGYRVTKIEGLE